MPEGCNVVLNSYLKSNGKSTGAADFEITMNYALFLRAHKHSPSKYINYIFTLARYKERNE